MHFHIGLPDFLTTAAYVIIFGFLWRMAAAKMSNTSLGQAMAVIY
jgi:hypothetical protein